MFFYVKTYIYYEKIQESHISLELKLSTWQVAHLICECFLSGPGERGRARIFGLFWVKISAADVKNHYKYEKSKENNISLEFNPSEEQSLGVWAFSRPKLVFLIQKTILTM